MGPPGGKEAQLTGAVALIVALVVSGPGPEERSGPGPKRPSDAASVQPPVHAMAAPVGPTRSPERFPVPQDTPAPRRPTTPPAAESWLGEDKLEHFLMSLAATSFAYAGARTVSGHVAAQWVGAGLGAAVGLLKEVRDARTGGDPSLRDLVWDAAGVTAGVVLDAQIR